MDAILQRQFIASFWATEGARAVLDAWYWGAVEQFDVLACRSVLLLLYFCFAVAEDPRWSGRRPFLSCELEDFSEHKRAAEASLCMQC